MPGAMLTRVQSGEALILTHSATDGGTARRRGPHKSQCPPQTHPTFVCWVSLTDTHSKQKVWNLRACNISKLSNFPHSIDEHRMKSLQLTTVINNGFLQGLVYLGLIQLINSAKIKNSWLATDRLTVFKYTHIFICFWMKYSNIMVIHCFANIPMEMLNHI